MFFSHRISALSIVLISSGAIEAFGNRTVVKINTAWSPKTADGLSSDLYDLSTFAHERLGYHTSHPGLDPTSCSETSNTSFDENAIIASQWRCSNNQSGSSLRVDLSKANNETLDQVIYKYKEKVIAMDITVSATGCTSVELQNLQALFREQSWVSMLIFSISVKEKFCLVSVLEELVTSFQAPNLQTLSVEHLDGTNSRHEKAFTALVNYIQDDTKTAINKQPTGEAWETAINTNEPEEQNFEKARVSFFEQLIDQTVVVDTCPAVVEQLDIEQPCNSAESITVDPDPPSLQSPGLRFEADLSKPISDSLHENRKEVATMDITATDGSTFVVLENLDRLLEEPWVALRILSVSVEESNLLAVILKKIVARLQAPKLEMMTFESLDDTNPEYAEAVKTLWKSLRDDDPAELEIVQVSEEQDSVTLEDRLIDQSQVVMKYPEVSDVSVYVSSDKSYTAVDPTFWAAFASVISKLIEKIAFMAQALVRQMFGSKLELVVADVKSSVILPAWEMLERAQNIFRGF